MQFVNCTPSPRKSPISMQGKQGKTYSQSHRSLRLYKQKKSMKSTSKLLEIPPISTQRTMKTTDQILSQRSPITGTTKTTKYTIETKRSMSPEELKSFRKSNKTQKNQKDTNNAKQRSPLSTEKKQHSNKMSIQQYMKEKKKSEQLKEKLLQQNVLNEQQKKLCNLQKLQIETKQIIENAKKIKKRSSKRLKQKKQKIDQIIKRFEEISKRYEKVQLDQIDKFQQEVAKHQQSYKTQTEIESQINYNQEDFDAFNEYYLHQAALLIQIHWKEHKKRKNQQNKKTSQSKLQQISIDWEPQQLVSQQTSPSNFEDGFLFCQGGEKQVHISNIRSSIISEESSPIVSQLNQEFENWNLFTQRIVKDKDISSINKQMQQQIISIVQNHLKQSENISERRSENEVLQEKSINKHQKQLSEDLSKFNVLQLQKQSQEEENLFYIQGMMSKILSDLYDVEQKNAIGKDHQLLEEWLNRELEDLQNTRKAFEIGHRREISTLKKIQRDILIASAELQSDPQDNLQIQQIQQQIDEQFNGLKVTKQNSNKLQEEIHQTVDLVTNEILNDMMMELSEEVLNKREDLYLLISNLVVNQDEPPCVPTSMTDISSYIDNLFKYIMENHKQSLISNLSVPFGFTPKQRLRLIHGNEDDDIDNNKEFQDQIAFPIDEAIFVEYENQRLPATDNDDDEIGSAILELQHIHNKAIFDACNEVLNSYRPFYYNSGIKYPWEQKRNRLSKISNQSLDHIMVEVKSTVLKQSKVLCGFYPTEEFEIIKQEKQEIIDEKNILMLMQQLNLVENPLLVDTNIQFDNLALIRDEQLYKLLIEDIKEQEYKWALIEDDRAEYLMELSDQILENLIEEVSKEM